MLWIKTLHVLTVMGWLAGIFYLPRIFVHYQEGRAAGEDVRRLQIMARRLYGFMSVMATFAGAFGAWLIVWYHLYSPSLGYKLLLVLALLVYHGYLHRLLRRLTAGVALPGSVALRWINEGALLIVVPILVMVIVKPFG